MLFMLAIQRKKVAEMGENEHALIIQIMKLAKVVPISEAIDKQYAKVFLKVFTPAEGGFSTRVEDMSLNLGLEDGQWKVISQTSENVIQIPNRP